MKAPLITLFLCACAFTVSASDLSRIIHHYSPHGYSNRGSLGHGHGYNGWHRHGNGGYNSQQYYNRGYSPGNSAFGHSHNPNNYNNNWDGHLTQRSNYGNLFNLFNR